MKPCADCRRAADAYVASAVRNFMHDSAPTAWKQRNAAVKVARALHEIHAARKRRVKEKWPDPL